MKQKNMYLVNIYNNLFIDIMAVVKFLPSSNHMTTTGVTTLFRMNIYGPSSVLQFPFSRTVSMFVDVEVFTPCHP